MHSNPQTEAVVVGALLDATGPAMRKGAQNALAETGLVGEDFTESFLRALFGAINALAERDRGIDANTVWTLLKGNTAATEASYKRLHELANGNTCNAATLQIHVQELKRLSRLRALTAFHQEQLKRLDSPTADPARASEDIDVFAKSFSGTEEDFTSGERYVEKILESWDAATQGKRLGFLPTGIEMLDQEVQGWVENLNIIAGASSVGKSALLNTAMLNAMGAGHRIAVFGLEDGTEGFVERCMALKSGVTLKAVGRLPYEQLTEHYRNNVQEESAKLWELCRHSLIGFEPKDGARLKSSKLLQLCKRAIVRDRVRAVFIDHILEVEHEASNRSEEKDLRMRIRTTLSGLRNLAIASHTPIVVAMHLNRAGAKSDGAPRQEDLAECADAERMARLILGVWTLPDDSRDSMRVTVMKQTRGARLQNLMLRRETEAGMVKNKGGELFTWPPPRQQRKSGERAPWQE